MDSNYYNIETGNLLELYKPGIIAFINEEKKEAFVSECKCIAEGFLRHVTMIKKGVHKIDTQEFINNKCQVIKFVKNEQMLRYAYADVIESLNKQGYKIISRHIEYKVKGVVDVDFRTTGKGYLYYVYLHAQKDPVKLLGVFNSAIDGDAFIKQHYQNKRISDMNIIVADNHLTKFYIDTYEEMIYNKLLLGV